MLRRLLREGDAISQPADPGDPSIRLRSWAPLACLSLYALAAWAQVFHRDLYRHVMTAWGVPVYGVPFVDLRNLGASIECWRHGVDVYRANPCDMFGRAFPYSRLWLDLGARIPVYPSITAAGVGLGLAFIASLGFAARPRRAWESVAVVAAAISTASAYALERANVDLAVFVVVIVAAGMAGRGFRLRAASYAAIVIAGLLKFYPFAALFIALRETPRRLLAIALLALVSLAALVFSMRADLAAALANVPGRRFGADAFGASNGLYLAPGLSPMAFATAFAVLSIGCIALALRMARDDGLARALDRLDEPDVSLLIVPAAIVVGCFFAGQSIIYRAVFLIPVVGGLIALRRAADDPATRRRLARLTLGAVALTWSWAALAQDLHLGLPLSAMVLVAREIVWWWLVASLMAILMIFAARSPLFVRLRGAV